MQASATWVNADRFVGVASSGHALVVDGGEPKLGSSPMELVLIGLCGCTATGVTTILRKKGQSWTRLEVSAAAECGPGPGRVFTAIRLLYRVSSQRLAKSNGRRRPPGQGKVLPGLAHARPDRRHHRGDRVRGVSGSMRASNPRPSSAIFALPPPRSSLASPPTSAAPCSPDASTSSEPWFRLCPR